MSAWTRDPPTKTGWYWVRHHGHHIYVCEVILDEENKLRFGPAEMPVEWCKPEDYEWCGPLEVPKESA